MKKTRCDYVRGSMLHFDVIKLTCLRSTVSGKLKARVRGQSKMVSETKKMLLPAFLHVF